MPAGISVADASPGFLNAVRSYLGNGGMVFADSGAFGAFRKGRRLSSGDFHQVLSVYGDLLKSARPGNLHVVAPDVIADQDATLTMLHSFAFELGQLSAGGAVVLVPLQRGHLSLSEMHSRATACLPGLDFCCALPSNAAAISSDEVMGFLSAVRPKRVHFLGAARSTRFQSLLQEARHMLPECAFTYDAAVVRQLIPKLHRDESQVEQRAVESLASGSIDEGEIAEALREGDQEMLGYFSRAIHKDPERASVFSQKVKNRCHAMGSQDLIEGIESLMPEFEHLWPYLVSSVAREITSKGWRRKVLGEQPEFHSDPAPRCSTDLLALA